MRRCANASVTVGLGAPVYIVLRVANAAISDLRTVLLKAPDPRGVR